MSRAKAEASKLVRKAQKVQSVKHAQAHRDLVQKQWERLQGHQERYVKAYCARYDVNPAEFDNYELVVDVGMADEGTTRTRTFMRRKDVEALDVPAALATMKAAMDRDLDFARGWHANLAVMAQDAGGSWVNSQAYASTFMRNAFNVDYNPLPDAVIVERPSE